jgi:hypothetical protein
VVDLVQSGIALLLLCLNLGEIAINHRHPLLVLRRKAVTGWTAQWRSWRLSAAATHPSETVLVKSGGQDWLSALGTFGICSGYIVAIPTTIL